MRWDDLVGDLEQQASGLQALERDAEVAERTRIENARGSFADRLRAQVGKHLRVGLIDGSAISGTLVRVAADFLLIAEARSEAFVPLSAVAWLQGVGQVQASASGVVSTLGLRSAVRALARDRATVTMISIGGAPVGGTPGRVGADYVEVALHPADTAPRLGAVRSVLLVPFANLVMIKHPIDYLEQ